MLQQFDLPHVHIGDPDKVSRLVANIINGGKSNLQVIVDFDRTLTKFRSSDGIDYSTCHNALEITDILPKEYRQKSRELLKHYYEIEINPDMTIEEKIPHMVEWWSKSHALLIPYKLSRLQLHDIVQNSNIVLREGVLSMFKLLDTLHIPLLIFSAGLGDVIELAIKKQCRLYDNIHIVSNYMQFDDQEILTGFRNHTIHTFNKDERAVRDSSYFDELSDRRNVLLVGDSLGDLTMASGARDTNNLLKIGFLNDKEDALIETYKKKYDIVLTGDGDFSLVLSLLQSL